MNLKKIKAILLGTALLSAQLKNQQTTYAAESISLMTEELSIYEIKNEELIKVEQPNKEVTGLEIILTTYEVELSWLKEFQNLETLKIYNTEKNTDLSFLPSLPNLKNFTLYEGKKGEKTNLDDLKLCQNLETLEINSPINLDLAILKDMKNLNTLWIMNGTYENIELLKEYKNIETLKISVNEYTPKNLIESLTHLKKLKLYIKTTENIEYQKLTFLEELSFGNSKAYSIIVNFTTTDFNTLKNHGVEIKSDKTGTIEKVIELNKELDIIIASLEIDNLPQKEKIAKIVSCVLEKLNYDEKVKNYLKRNIDIEVYASSFYKEGVLYGALEKETSICGNYAALLKALLKRAGIEAYYLQNPHHAWNLIKFENNYYYIDSSILDENYEIMTDENLEENLLNPTETKEEIYQLDIPVQNLIRK